MAKNKIQLKRSFITGRTPNTTISSNSQYIDIGELALNLTDRKLYTSDGTNLIDLTSSASSVDVSAQYIWSNTQTFTNTITFSSTINGTANSADYIGSLPAANVVSNSQLQSNLASYQTTAGLSSSVATLSANASTYLNGKTESNLNVNNALTSNNASYLGTVAAANYVRSDVDGAVDGQLAFTKGANTIALTNSTSNWIYWTGAGTAAPTFTTRSAGTKVVLYPTLGASQVDYALGINSGTLWSSIPGNDGGQFFKWYGGTTEVASLSGTGNLLLNGSVNAAAYTVGSSWIANTSGVYMTMPLSANGGVGSAGQVLTSNGSTGAPYWSTVSGGGGGASVTVSDTAPSSPTSGTLWYYTGTGELFVYYNDGDSSQWVTAAAASTPSIVPNATNATNANNASYLGGVAAANYASTGKAIAMAIVFGG